MPEQRPRTAAAPRPGVGMAFRRAVDLVKRLPSQLGGNAPGGAAAAIGDGELCGACAACGVRSYAPPVGRAGIGAPAQSATGVRPARHQQMRGSSSGGGAQAAAAGGAAQPGQRSALFSSAQPGQAQGSRWLSRTGLLVGGGFIFGMGYATSATACVLVGSMLYACAMHS